MFLLLLLTVVTTLKPRLVSAAVTDRSAAEWDRYSLQRGSRGFRFGGADRFSHGFGRRRRVDDMKDTSPLS